MRQFTLVHEVLGTPRAFLTWFLDDRREEDLYKGALRYGEYTTTEARETDTVAYRRAVFSRPLDLPGALAKLVGGGHRESQDGRLDKAAGVWSWKIAPGALADKIRQEGTLRLEPQGTDRTRLISEHEIEAKIFQVGGLFETSLEKYTRQEWDRLTAFYGKPHD
ncbi:DUF2505 family protein [Streptomyces sp. NPDC093094]|uniref:DUF2505 family protein n=1 Tax=Streptomyces sp. NPDC093094 TaxID=3366026 RepID=UPI0037FF00FF